MGSRPTASSSDAGCYVGAAANARRISGFKSNESRAAEEKKKASRGDEARRHSTVGGGMKPRRKIAPGDGRPERGRVKYPSTVCFHYRNPPLDAFGGIR